MKSLILRIVTLCFFVSIVSAQNQRAIVQDIVARPVSTTQIELNWQLPNSWELFLSKNTKLAIYRSTTIISNLNELETSQEIIQLPISETKYIDTVPEYREYYYAVMIKTDSANEITLVIPAVNATVIGIRPMNEIKEDILQTETLSAKEKTTLNSQGFRILPLPYLDLQTQTSSQSKISEKTTQEALKLAEETKYAKKFTPYVFRNEQSIGKTGEELILYDIIQNHFLQGQYKEAQNLLLEFLQLNRSEDITSRAMFYLAETYFFMGEYENALSSLLLVQNVFPELTSRWIQNTLDSYSLPIPIE